MRERRYLVEFVRNGERKGWHEFAFNKDDAYLKAVKKLEAMGEKPGGGPGDNVRWWYVGARRD